MKKLYCLRAVFLCALLASCIPARVVPDQGSIRGILWHDVCKFTEGPGDGVVVLESGCVQLGDDALHFGPNQLLDNGEGGWPGITIHLGEGNCPSIGLMTVTTDPDGEYRFENLEDGVYCVSYDNHEDGNDSILLPGSPTFPSRDDAGFSTHVTLEENADLVVNFGYTQELGN